MVRKPGIKDVAREAGVSVGTVSNVINRPATVTPATLARVEEVIEELGYVPSGSARQLRVGRSRMMALLVLDVGNPFYADIARGADRAARAAGLGVMVCSSKQDVVEEAHYLSLFAEQQVVGVIITPTVEAATALGGLGRHGTPHVLVDATPADAGACAVRSDDVLGGRLALQHLLGTGHRRIAFIGGPRHLRQMRDRHSGARQALADKGFAPDALVDIPVERADVGAGRDAAARLLGLPHPPTAAFCANDLLALGLLQAFYAAGVKVPDDIAIVGYDDIEFAAAATVPLTSVRRPAVVMGQVAAELLLAEAGNSDPHEHREVILIPELVVRDSTLARR